MTPELQRVLNLGRSKPAQTPPEDLDLKEIIDAKFTSGEGVMVIDPKASDADLARLLRIAMLASDGQPFTVIPSPVTLGEPE